VIAAAGNEAISLDDAVAAGWAYPPCSSPAANVICVGASDTDTGSMTTFSNYGTTSVDLYAPGTSVCNGAPSKPWHHQSKHPVLKTPLACLAPCKPCIAAV
jgi:hypothetical protein